MRLRGYSREPQIAILPLAAARGYCRRPKVARYEERLGVVANTSAIGCFSVLTVATRGEAGPGLLAHVLIAKFLDHLPLYRQAEIYARGGAGLDRATLADWVGKAAWLVKPLAERIGSHVMAGSVIHADDTPVPVLAPGNGKTKTGRLGLLAR